ncbi:MAG TPA: FkbM family methyltransferase [Leptospiraceae bacterium]|nr:FkbM family methyltransferase [Leptospiraceae bacterium]HMX31616.1 FkbM family methyltransferase [Leptospiraceae bacterium]HMZ65566.1 FkbM family methyltransferase [Leptospiraceae bacterium]HNA06505.1 FkbM family methyltransferase [Leptospiraceae bacterium]HNC54984.1 FkbM family methyltransferase [Leptospiraceae bacterium]
MNNFLSKFIRDNINEQFFIFDIGAYKGEFAEQFVEKNINSIIYSFEPDKNSYTALSEKYKKNSFIYNLAISNYEGQKKFYQQKKGYRSSLLKDNYSEEDTEIIDVKVTTFDHFMNQEKIEIRENSKIIFKTDTQGNDLNVLKGAESFLKKYKPIIITEVIFQPLYDSQCHYLDILNFLFSIGYELVYIDGTHLNTDEKISYSDYYFQIKEDSKSDKANSSFHLHIEESVNKELEMYKTAAKERLDLIQRLDQECNDRLKVIEWQQKEIEKLKSK